MSNAALSKAYGLAKALSEQQNRLYTLIVAIQDRAKDDYVTYALASVAIEMIRNGQIEPELLQCLAEATGETA